MIYLVQTSGSALVEMTYQEIAELRRAGFDVRIVQCIKVGK